MSDQNNAPERLKDILGLADRAAPEGQVRGYTEIADIIDRNITDETVNGHHRLLLEGEWYEGPVVDWLHKTLTGIRDLLRKYAALTPPPAAQEPDAIRHSFDGYGWLYADQGNGSDWRKRASDYPDAEPLYTAPPPACQQEAVTVAELIGGARLALDTGAISFGETADYRPEDIQAILDTLDKALHALKGERG